MGSYANGKLLALHAGIEGSIPSDSTKKYYMVNKLYETTHNLFAVYAYLITEKDTFND